MKSDSITVWLKKKKAWGFVQYESFGVAGFVAGLVVVVLTFWLTYAIIWFGWYGISAASEIICNKRLPSTSHELRLLGSGIFIVLLFVQHFRTNPSHWGDYPERDYGSSTALRLQAGFGALGMLLAYPGASANMITDILLTGPRLVTGSCGLARQGFRIKDIDETGCTAVLFALISRVHTVTYDEMKEAGWEAYVNQLRYIDGVEFLQKGLFLSEELRSELNNLPNA